MDAETAKRIARKYVKDELAVMDLAIEIVKSNTEGYKEAVRDYEETKGKK